MVGQVVIVECYRSGHVDGPTPGATREKRDLREARCRAASLNTVKKVVYCEPAHTC